MWNSGLLRDFLVSSSPTCSRRGGRCRRLPVRSVMSQQQDECHDSWRHGEDTTERRRRRGSETRAFGGRLPDISYERATPHTSYHHADAEVKYTNALVAAQHGHGISGPRSPRRQHYVFDCALVIRSRPARPTTGPTSPETPWAATGYRPAREWCRRRRASPAST